MTGHRFEPGRTTSPTPADIARQAQTVREKAKASTPPPAKPQGTK